MASFNYCYGAKLVQDHERQKLGMLCDMFDLYREGVTLHQTEIKQRSPMDETVDHVSWAFPPYMLLCSSPTILTSITRNVVTTSNFFASRSAGSKMIHG